MRPCNSPEATLKRSITISRTWKEKYAQYEGLCGKPFYNSWRAIRFTEKGKRIGCEEKWEDFLGFKTDMFPTYKAGLRMCRYDKRLPFSKENCFWAKPEELSANRLKKLEYNGEVKTIREWCLQYNLNTAGVMQRSNAKNYTPHEILFGILKKPKRELLNAEALDYQFLRNKASKMMAQYRCYDKKKGFELTRFSIEWFIENILRMSCVYCGISKNVGADRVDNFIGHTKENIVPACYRCNTTRGNQFSYEEMRKLGKFIKENIDTAR